MAQQSVKKKPPCGNRAALTIACYMKIVRKTIGWQAFCKGFICKTNSQISLLTS